MRTRVAVLAVSGQVKDADLIESGMRALDAALQDMVALKAAGEVDWLGCLCANLTSAA